MLLVSSKAYTILFPSKSNDGSIDDKFNFGFLIPPTASARCTNPHEKTSGPFSSWVSKAKGRFGRGPFSRAAKQKDEVDDLLNSDAFLNKKVQILEKQIKATQADTVTAIAQADEQWQEWGPQVSGNERCNGVIRGILVYFVGCWVVELWPRCPAKSTTALGLSPTARINCSRFGDSVRQTIFRSLLVSRDTKCETPLAARSENVCLPASHKRGGPSFDSSNLCPRVRMFLSHTTMLYFGVKRHLHVECG